eukprot:TRINITY_DN5128_c0_g1_i1.p1 TRINITY_DN5128_c0_g1~~TRINITY_DN5128_c0_g1_i1.p1  ORF type:complete len:304 (-),score=64.75 TRINITY_DN5128_c0_g1_i1:36-947(-)
MLDSREESSQNLHEISMIELYVTDPVKIGSALSKSISFRVHGIYNGEEFSCNRTYEDFVWYQKYLSNEYAYLLVPTFDKKKSLMFGDSQRRCYELERFLHKVALRGKFVQDAWFLKFITRDAKRFKSERKSIKLSSGLGMMQKFFTSSGGDVDENYEKVSNTKTTIEESQKSLCNMHQQILNYASKTKDLGKELFALAENIKVLNPEFGMSVEISSALSEAIDHDGTIMGDLEEIHRSDIAETVRGWIEDLMACKDLISRYESARDAMVYYAQEYESKRDKTESLKTPSNSALSDLSNVLPHV